MRGPPARYEPVTVTADREADVADVVRTLLHQRMDPEKIPLHVENTLGITRARVAEELARVARADRERERRRRRTLAVVAVVAVIVGVIADRAMGSSRALGTLLLLLALGTGLAMLAWLLHESRNP